MNKKEIVEMVSKLLSFAKDEPVAPVATEYMAPVNELKTKDGKVLATMAPKWDIGVEVMVDGEVAPDGEYELEDGSKVIVAEGKVLDMIAIEEAPVEAEMASVTSPSAPKETTTTTIEKVSFSAEEKYSELNEKFNKVLEATIVLTEAFNKLPVTEKIAINASIETEEFGKTKLNKKERNLKEMRSVLEEIHNDQNKNNKK